MAKIAADYLTRCYAGVLGKIIGVYLGRPFEGWKYETLTELFGEVSYYVNNLPHYVARRHNRQPHPLIVTDDDISGTFTFFRALEDHGFDAALSAEQIGRSWMNYIIENKTVLWWGGLGTSTEHTAYLRMKQGVPAPRCGSIELNGPVVAEQIGAQIFIDAWGLCSPGNPAQAAKFARAAGTVSHDGEAVHGAVVVAAMIAEAFVDPDINHLLDTALSFVPAESTIARMIGDIRRWHRQDNDWRKTRAKIQEAYGYEKFGGGCHMVPNHALIILALLYAPESFSRSLMIVNTCGWDTDCNSANVGCIQGVRLGLEAINREHDWRGPVADRMFIPTAEGGRCISDAVEQTWHIARAAHKLAGGSFERPKAGARFSFALPGSVQGFLPIVNELGTPTAAMDNAAAPKELGGQRALRIVLGNLGSEQAAGAYVSTFFSVEDARMEGYALIGSPLVYPGQTVSARLYASPTEGTLKVRLAAVYHGEEDKAQAVAREWQVLPWGAEQTVTWKIPETDGRPIAQLRLEFGAIDGDPSGATVYVDRVEIEGTPSGRLIPASGNKGDMWLKAWVNAAYSLGRSWYGVPGISLIQNEGVGIASIGNEQWSNYRFEATLKPHLAETIGIGVAYRGLTRHVRLMLRRDGMVRLEQHEHGQVQELARGKGRFELYREVKFAVEWNGATVRCLVDGQEPFAAVTLQHAPSGGGVAVFLEGGRAFVTDAMIVPL